VRGRQWNTRGGVNLFRVHCIRLWNYHNETLSYYDVYELNSKIKKKKKKEEKRPRETHGERRMQKEAEAGAMCLQAKGCSHCPKLRDKLLKGPTLPTSLISDFCPPD
jgi:hypothetical protein